ncbi:MAG: hypothetical protein U5L96_20025 [Owenweeksia sp.]|nr:hypothetical protein [Owenweeksia sp.]
MPAILTRPTTATGTLVLLRQQAMIPSFVAAYSGTDLGPSGLNPEKSFPLPNWQITYDGLTKIKSIRDIFQSAVLEHGYRSLYSVNNMSTNLLRRQDLEDEDRPLDNNGDLYPVNQVNAVVLSEQFSPLLGINMKLKGNATFRLQYKKNRNVTL